ncbi:hypothetical protein ACRALDRAFT_2114167 [Sodiomyces alcalophilus JCM 7366]|uniref:uncharacterized protein n=1 Tax=Sodiomyces alcalophilus JCM 7366 TaxID=591952 RepID=UPI0039B62ED9
MLSLRSLTRSAPRQLGRLSAAATARPASLLRTTSSFNSVSRVQRVSAFSTSVFRRAAAGETDEELAAKLDSELQFEEEVKQNEQVPASVKDFLDNSPFELEDIAGKEDVKLVRKFGDEKISVIFSIADLANYDPEMYEQDRALEDEDDLDAASGSKQQSGATPAEEAEEDHDYDEAAPPTRLTILVEKPGRSPGALNIDAVAQDGAIVIENLFYYEDAALANPATPADAQRRADVYPGPPFGSLDEDLQILLERYLEERGVTQALAVFAPDYVDVKEQREYVRWLNNVKGFVNA